MVLPLTDDTAFRDDVLLQSGLVLVDFFLPECKPCILMTPTVNALAAKYAGRIKVIAVNVEAAPVLGLHYNLSRFPTLMVFRNGQVEATLSGRVPQATIENILDQALLHD